MFNNVLVPVWISLKTAVVATLISFCFGVFAAWWMNQYQGRAKGLIDGILTAPLVLPPTVVGFLLLLALGKNGWLGKPLDSVGMQLIFTWYAAVIAAAIVAFPLMYKTTLAAFQQSDDNLIGCARTLGASEAAIFWRITLPLAKPGLIAGTLLSFARALGEFGATLMVAGSIPGKTQTIPIAIFFAAESGAMDQALWLVIILLVISLTVVLGASYWGESKKKTQYQASRLRGSGIRQTLLDKTVRPEQMQLEVDIQKQLPDFLLDITFQISGQQSPLGILGSSGAGKTTLLQCIAGLATPDRGKIVLNNQILFDSAKGINLSPQERRVGLVFQDYALFPHLTIAENIAFGMSSMQSALAVKEAVNYQLKQVDLRSKSDRLPHQLSGGEQQRVALARVLASRPSLILLDEPLSALDTDLKSKLIKLLQQRLSSYSGLSFYITHNLREAYYLCPQLLIIDQSQAASPTNTAIAFDKKENLASYPPNSTTAQIMGCSNFSQARMITADTIQALDWQCELKIELPVAKNLSQIGIYAQAIEFAKTKSGTNILPVWLADYHEAIDQVNLYLKLHSEPDDLADYHLEIEITPREWQQQRKLAFPWYIHLPASKILMFAA